MNESFINFVSIPTRSAKKTPLDVFERIMLNQIALYEFRANGGNGEFRINGGQAINPLWRENPDGTVLIKLRYGHTLIKTANGSGVVVENLEKLPEVFRKLILFSKTDKDFQSAISSAANAISYKKKNEKTAS